MRLKAEAPRLQLPPHKVGSAGRAWKVDIDAVRALTPGRPDSGLCMWIVEAPWAHPVWHSYWIGVVHLRPVPGLQEPVFFLRGATHEVMLYALDPSHTPALDKPQRFLFPANFHGQWQAQSDEEAVAKIEGCVDDIIAGTLSPDTDHVRSWIDRFSDSNVKVDPALAGATLVGVSGDGSVTIVGTGKTAVDALTTIAAGPTPPKKDLH
jgi:hypothetical protein